MAIKARTYFQTDITVSDMEGANVEIIKSTNGKDKIYVGGYLYEYRMSWIRNCLEEGLRMSVKSNAVMEIELVNATDVFMLKKARLLK